MRCYESAWGIRTALSQHSSQDSSLVDPSESFADPIEIESSDDEQVDSVIAGMTDEQKSIPVFNTFHPKIPNKQVCVRKVRGGLQDDGLLKATVTPRRSKRGRPAPTDAEYRPSKSVKLSKPKAKPKGQPTGGGRVKIDLNCLSGGVRQSRSGMASERPSAPGTVGIAAVESVHPPPAAPETTSAPRCAQDASVRPSTHPEEGYSGIPWGGTMDPGRHRGTPGFRSGSGYSWILVGTVGNPGSPPGIQEYSY